MRRRFPWKETRTFGERGMSSANFHRVRRTERTLPEMDLPCHFVLQLSLGTPTYFYSTSTFGMRVPSRPFPLDRFALSRLPKHSHHRETGLQKCAAEPNHPLFNGA